MPAAAHSHDSGDIKPEVTCWDGVSEYSLARALSGAVTDCVEIDILDLRTDWHATRRTSGRRLTLKVTTCSAYRHPVARTFIQALEDRLTLSRDLHDRVLTALQEALMNAMLHGNLGLTSASSNDFRGLAEAHKSIEARLASDHVAHSMIGVDAHWTSRMLKIAILDSGRGFKRNELPSRDITSPKCSGRGLSILEAMCDRIAYLQGGATIELSFLLTGTAD